MDDTNRGEQADPARGGAANRADLVPALAPDRDQHRAQHVLAA